MFSDCLLLPEGFEEYAWEVEAKGYFSEAKLVLAGRQYRLNFIDPVRLSQDVATEFESGRIFFEPNLVVIPSVTRANMEKAVEELLMQSGIAKLLTADS